MSNVSFAVLPHMSYPLPSSPSEAVLTIDDHLPIRRTSDLDPASTRAIFASASVGVLLAISGKLARLCWCPHLRSSNPGAMGAPLQFGSSLTCFVSGGNVS